MDIKGRIRPLLDPYKKERDKVGAAIRKALKKIEEKDHKLYDHIWNSMGKKVGTYPCYSPDKSIEWNLY